MYDIVSDILEEAEAGSSVFEDESSVVETERPKFVEELAAHTRDILSTAATSETEVFTVLRIGMKEVAAYLEPELKREAEKRRCCGAQRGRGFRTS